MTIMTIPLQITFRQMQPSHALEARIRALVTRLARFSDHVQRCHVIIEPLPGHSQQGALYEFRIAMKLPDQEIAIYQPRPADHSHEDPYVALRDAFRAARRKLQDYERKKRGDVKRHTAVVEDVP
jgi:ribosome-associated translation inhibitor RaiA